MNYIKSFNESLNGTYEKIERDIFLSFVGDGEEENNVIDFTKSEIKSISSCLKRYKLRYSNGYSDDVVSILADKSLSINGLVNRDIDIYKIRDEWFFIVNQTGGWHGKTVYFKCDQLDGLIDAILFLMKGYKKQDYNTELLRTDILQKIKTIDLDNLLKIKNILDELY